MAGIEVDQLGKRFGRNAALRGVSLSVPEGAAAGLLGPNGAGKTTLVRILAGLLAADSGRAVVNGFDVAVRGHEVRRGIGMLSETADVYGNLTAVEYLAFFARLHGVAPAEIRARSGELLERFGLGGRSAEPLRRYSKGMRQRLCLARALLHRPRLLLLDEPASGLDPAAARALLDTLRALRAERGLTLLVCSHDLAGVAGLCDRFAILHRGVILEQRLLAELEAAAGAEVVIRLAEPRPAYRAALERDGWACRAEGDALLVRVRDPRAANPALVAALAALGAGIVSVEIRRADLVEHYLEVVGQADGRHPVDCPQGMD